MGVDLIFHGYRISWQRLLEIALEFGWRPARTELPPDWNLGDDIYVDSQAVSDADAMGAALFRASAAIRSSTLTEKQRELLEGIPVDTFHALARFASSED